MRRSPWNLPKKCQQSLALRDGGEIWDSWGKQQHTGQYGDTQELHNHAYTQIDSFIPVRSL